MSRALKGRLHKVEARHGRKRGFHVIYGDDEAGAARQLEALKASGAYQEGDYVFRLRSVSEEMADRFRNRGR